MPQCKTYFNILNHSGATQECDKQTDRHVYSKSVVRNQLSSH